MTEINMHNVRELRSHVAKYNGFSVHSFTGVNSKGHPVSIHFYTDDADPLQVKETTYSDHCKPKENINANE